MFARKILLPIVAMFGLVGCLSSHYYVLSTPSQPSSTYQSKHLSIGVEKVVVPEYLFKREIAVAKSDSEVTFVSDGTWAEDMDAGLTTRLIGFLQKKFNAPNVHLYPWDTDAQPSKKVKVQISRFIAQKGNVYLDATWEVKNMRTNHTKARLFHTVAPSKSMGTTDIVEAMNEAFHELEEVIAKGIR